MKVLVTGSNGQVGRALVATAPAATEVVALARPELDIADPAAVDATVRQIRPELIVNAAAYTAVDRAESEPDTAYAINRDGAAHLARAAAATGARLVQISTDFVFDGALGTPYHPDALIAPVSVYGRSKAEGEHAVHEALATALIVRTSWVYAADGKNFVETMLRLMARPDALRVVADQVGTPTHAASLAAAIWSLADARAEGVLHFTDAGVASWYDFAVAIQEIALTLGLLDHACAIVPIPTAAYPTPATRPAYSVLDKDATWALLGRPARHWRTELADMLAAKQHEGAHA